jgi:hypothetical protein
VHEPSVLELVTARRKALPGFFFLYFQLPYLPQETCFQQAGPSAVEGTSHAVLGFSRTSEGTNQPVTISKK